MKKERLDILMVEKGFASSRTKAKALIMAGQVLVDEEREEKAGTMISPDQVIRLKKTEERFVSRGGYKLLQAITNFSINLKNKHCMDIGASTGGFTDCMLQHGASKVYSIDVGYGQFAWSLRQDSRVVVLEKTNVRYLSEQQVPELIDFASIDVSFISLTKIIDAVQNRLKYLGEVVCLIKPQFEAGKDKVGKKGVVRDEKVHFEVIENIISVMMEKKFKILGLDYSPIKGPAGNIEYLLYMENQKNNLNEEEDEFELIEDKKLSLELETKIWEIVKKSHEMAI